MEEMSPWEDMQCVSSQEPAGSKAKSNPSCYDCRSPCALCSPMRREQRWGGDRGHSVERPVQPQLGPGQLRIFGLRTLFCSNRIWAKWPMGLSSRVLHSSGQSGGKRAQMLQMAGASRPSIPFLCRTETVIMGETQTLLKSWRQDGD